MNEILQAVLDGDYVTFNEKFKDKLKGGFDKESSKITDDFNKTAITEMTISDGSQKIVCKNCGKEIAPGIPMMGSCPYCGDLLV